MILLGGSSAITVGSSAFAALIWWVVPVGALIGGIGYVIWISKFKGRFESETSRSVGNFQRFQESFRTETQLPGTQISEPQAPEIQSPEHRDN
jgi:CHASE2 domain-containing sensor protein